MDCGTALSSGYVTDRVLFYNFQILFKQTSIIAADIYKHVSVLPSQKRYREFPPDSGTTGYSALLLLQAPTPTTLKNVFVMYSVFFVIMMCDL